MNAACGLIESLWCRDADGCAGPRKEKADKHAGPSDQHGGDTRKSEYKSRESEQKLLHYSFLSE
eukprot:6181781-Amphidinium_carterae.1